MAKVSKPSTTSGQPGPIDGLRGQGRAGAPAVGDADRGRRATEALLEDTAVEMVLEHGVLAGLNLREVAKRAGLNRGLIYHYYGSREELLGRAFLRRLPEFVDVVNEAGTLSLRARVQQWLWGAIAHSTPIRLASICLLDGTVDVRVMPRRQATQQELARDVAGGHLDASVDPSAFNALVPAALYGYVIFREAFAAEMGLRVEELDERVGALLDRLMASLRPSDA
jgi:AcrR family transcriptional regulator